MHSVRSELGGMYRLLVALQSPQHQPAGGIKNLYDSIHPVNSALQ